MGGMFGESKYDILTRIPSKLIPKTIRLDHNLSAKDSQNLIETAGLIYPLIFKPDLGERGFMVKKIKSSKDIQPYLQDIHVDFLVQELVELPLEFGVFYQRHPSKPEGRVVSLVMKEMLSVQGDGVSTLKELILGKDRAKLQWDKLSEAYADRLNEIPGLNQKIELVSIGNHALGTKFLNGNHLINEKLSATFDQIAKKIDGFFFGRFDLKCASLEDLYNGNVKILELNGCGAEPAHIYDPDFKFFDAVVTVLRHWRTIFEIARENHKLGAPFETFSNGKKYYRKFKQATR